MAAGVAAAGKAIAIKPLSIVKLRDMDFASAIPGATGGTIIIDPTNDSRSVTGSVIAAGGTPLAAQFITAATAGRLLQVNHGGLPTLTRVGGGATMNVTQLTLNGPVLRTITATGILDLRVGGTLAVGANQLGGDYTGTFQIIVTYF
jgi:hypothetical protein